MQITLRRLQRIGKDVCCHPEPSEASPERSEGTAVGVPLSQTFGALLRFSGIPGLRAINISTPSTTSNAEMISVQLTRY